MIKQFFTIAMLVLIGAGSQAAVWTTENQWSDVWEQKYREWLRTVPNTHFFSAEKKPNGEPNPYYGLHVDCADLVYSNRIIFSYENKLPFFMVNPVSSRASLITNEITRFDKTPEGLPRFKRFLVWAYDMISTHSIPADTFSPPYNKIGSGSIILTTKTNHHSWTILDISKSGNPRLYFNSTAAVETSLNVQIRESWPNQYWVFEPEVDKEDSNIKTAVYKPGTYAGFRNWRPVEFLNQSEKLVPGYSEEQHTVGITKWKSTLFAEYAKVKETPDQMMKRLLNDACADFQQRVDSVTDTDNYKDQLVSDLQAGKTAEQSSYVKEYMSDPNHPNDPRCMTAVKFDDFSTPSRDKRFADALMLARVTYKSLLSAKGEKAFSPDNLATLKSLFPFINLLAVEESNQDKTPRSGEGFCSLKLNDSLGKLSLAEFKRRMFKGRFSSNPNDSVTGRFGYSKTSNDKGAACEAYGFVQKAYDLNQMEQDMTKELKSSGQ